MYKSICIVLLAVASANWAVAAPFNPEHIAAGAKWVIHVDMEALRDTAAGKMCREKFLNQEKVRKHLDEICEEIGMDPSEDLLGVTMYDTQLKKEHGVAIIHVRKMDGSRLIAKLNEKEPENRMLKYKKHELYLWTKRHHGKEMPVCGTLYNGRVMIFSRDALKVIAALDVLDGNGESLNDDSRLAGDVRDGAVFLMRGVGLAESQMLKKCPVLKDSNWLEVVMGANEGTSFASMEVDSGSKDMAKNVKAIMDGFAALARIKHGKHESFGKMLDGLETAAAGNTLWVEWSADEEDVINVMEEVQRKMKEHWKGRSKRGDHHKEWKKKLESHVHKWGHK